MAGRIVVFGHTGFIGSRLVTRLQASEGADAVVGASLTGVDLENAESAARAASLLTPDSTVVMCAAIKRQLGDSAEIYAKNTAIIVNFVRLVTENPVRRVVYLSSGAVYGEDIENLAITEDAPLVARSYYGLSKITAEWILEREIGRLPDTSLGILRPATIYGPGDVETAYGPSGFLHAAVEGRGITLWGDGSELRELLYIDDVVEVVARYVAAGHTGVLNVVAGASYTFTDALDAVRSVAGDLPPITSRPRSKPKVDNRYDNSRLKTLFPDLRFTPLVDGVRKTFEARYAQRSQPS